MAEVPKGFREWCVVEIMGHKMFAGLVTEQEIGGCSFVRVDVPEVTTPDTFQAGFTKLFGQGAIYCLSPCTEETARAFAERMRVESFSRYEAPRLPAPGDPQAQAGGCCDECDGTDETTER